MNDSAEVNDMLNENQRLVGELEQNWDEKVDQSKKIIEEKVVELEALGVTAGKSAGLRPEFYSHQTNLPFLEKKKSKSRILNTKI